MRNILIATRNAGKIPEIALGLHGLPFTPVSVQDVPAIDSFEPDESGETFEDNAELKAREYGKKAGMLTLADDSGLEIDALAGEPGVRSARYVEGTDIDRYRAVLEKMRDVPDDERTARFVSVVAVYDPVSDMIATTRGDCHGRIEREARGARGFGYDPIFFADELEKTYAEATLQEKMSVDHRSKALVAMREILLRKFL